MKKRKPLKKFLTKQEKKEFEKTERKIKKKRNERGKRMAKNIFHFNFFTLNFLLF